MGHLKRVGILIALAYLFLMLGNGIISLTNPDEVFYAQTAKEMIQHHSWMTPYLFGAPQFEKPILVYWLLRFGFMFSGISSFSARFFPSLFAILGVVAVYFLGSIGLKNKDKAFVSGLVLMSSLLYIGLARSVFTDMIFSVFILLSLLSFFWGYSQRDKKDTGILLFFIFASLAVLAKGPLGLAVPLLVILAFLLINKETEFLLCKSWAWGIFIFLLAALPWYILMINKYGSNFTHEFFYNDHFRRIIEAEHIENDRWYFYPFSMVVAIFPWSLFTVASFLYLLKRGKDKTKPLRIFLLCWIGVVFSIFQFAHSKLVSYVFPLCPAMALVTADFIGDSASVKPRSRPLFFASILTVIILLLIVISLGFAATKYSVCRSFKIPIYGLVVSELGLILLMIFFVFRNKLLHTAYTLALFNLLLLFTMPIIHSGIDPYISSKAASEYLLKNYKVNNTILCSKFFVRGVRYYTDKEVAVIDVPGKQFFSPHPVVFLDSDVKVREFLLSQAITYCILKKNSLEDLSRITENGLRQTKLKIIGNAYILKIERL